MYPVNWSKRPLRLNQLPSEVWSPLLLSSGAILLQTRRINRNNRYSYCAWEPIDVLAGNVPDLNLDKLSSFLEQHANNFVAGYLGYELGSLIEKVALTRSKDTPLPHIYLAAYDQFLQYDHLSHKWWLWYKCQSHPFLHLKSLKNRHFSARWLGTNQSLKTYLKNIEAILEYIRQGDVYEVNYTQRAYFEFKGCPYTFFNHFVKIQPVSYAAFINTPKGIVISGSPELFLRKEDNFILSKPMKGTRRRGVTPKEDSQLESELKSSSKDRAENLMIVDLMRNDFGKICQAGSVKAPRLFVIEGYATLFQMISYVSGQLLPNIRSFDILKATFPPGSITGAPKKRAMEIIAELEPHQRGVYTGAIGFFWGKKCVLNVAIRTLEIFGNTAVLGIGGGIVADSDPKQEYEESLLKAKATLRAIHDN